MTSMEGSLSYLAILVLIVLSLVLTAILILVNKVLSTRPRETTKIKYETFECGVAYEGDAHQQFSVRYYLIGIIFLIFDVEVVFMYPFTMVYKTYIQFGPMILAEIGLFFVLLLGGYFYLRMRGALSWD